MLEGFGQQYILQRVDTQTNLLVRVCRMALQEIMVIPRASQRVRLIGLSPKYPRDGLGVCIRDCCADVRLKENLFCKNV